MENSYIDEVQQSRPFKVTSYHESSCSEEITETGISEHTFTQALPSDIDIFIGLSEQAFDWPVVKSFFSFLRNSLTKANITDKTLSKLIQTEDSDEYKSFDWVFNYYRVSVTFGNNHQYSYCLIETRKEKNSFISKCAEMGEPDFARVADEIIQFVTERL